MEEQNEVSLQKCLWTGTKYLDCPLKGAVSELFCRAQLDIGAE